MKIVRTNKLLMFIVALTAAMNFSSCSDDNDSYTWSGFVRVIGSYGSYLFVPFEGNSISPTNQSDLPSDLDTYAYITAYYDAENNEGSNSNYRYMEIYEVTPLKECSVSSEIDEMSTFSNIPIKSFSNNSSVESIVFNFIYHMFIPISYYCLDSDDADTHEFKMYYDLDEATETTLTFHLRHNVDDASLNSSRLTCSNEYIYAKIDFPVYYYLVKFGSAPKYIKFDYPYNPDNAMMEEAEVFTLPDKIEYLEMYERLTADYDTSD